MKVLCCKWLKCLYCLVVRSRKCVSTKLTESLINTVAVTVKNDRGNVSLDEWFLTLWWVIKPSSSRIKQSMKISSLYIIPEDEDTMILWNAGNHLSFQQQSIKSQQIWIVVHIIPRNSNLAKVENFATQQILQ